MKQERNRYVSLIGTKRGMKLVLNDSCSFQELLDGMKQVLDDNTELFASRKPASIHVIVDTKNRLLSAEQEDQLKNFLLDTFHLEVDDITSNLMTKKEASEQLRAVRIVKLNRLLRMGDVVEIDGDVLLLGDVDPGAVLRATGSIYVMGSLMGSACAGSGGNSRAVICAGFMDPEELEIAGAVKSFSEEEIEETPWGGMFETAFQNENGAVILERVEQLPLFRSDLDEGTAEEAVPKDLQKRS